MKTFAHIRDAMLTHLYLKFDTKKDFIRKNNERQKTRDRRQISPLVSSKFKSINPP